VTKKIHKSSSSRYKGKGERKKRVSAALKGKKGCRPLAKERFHTTKKESRERQHRQEEGKDKARPTHPWLLRPTKKDTSCSAKKPNRPPRLPLLQAGQGKKRRAPAFAPEKREGPAVGATPAGPVQRKKKNLEKNYPRKKKGEGAATL